MKKKILLLILSITTICSSLIYANSTNILNKQATKEFNDRNQKFEKPENEVLGKITKINENEITITIAERNDDIKDLNNKPIDKENIKDKNLKDPKEEQQKDKKQDFSFKNRPTPSEPFNIENRLKLTNESKTYNIKNAKLLINFDPETNEKNKNESKYTDFKIDDYVSIETKDKNSLEAITVRKIGDFRKRANENMMKQNKSKKQ